MVINNHKIVEIIGVKHDTSLYSTTGAPDIKIYELLVMPSDSIVEKNDHLVIKLALFKHTTPFKIGDVISESMCDKKMLKSRITQVSQKKKSKHPFARGVHEYRVNCDVLENSFIVYDTSKKQDNAPIVGMEVNLTLETAGEFVRVYVEEFPAPMIP